MPTLDELTANLEHALNGGRRKRGVIARDGEVVRTPMQFMDVMQRSVQRAVITDANDAARKHVRDEMAYYLRDGAWSADDPGAYDQKISWLEGQLAGERARLAALVPAEQANVEASIAAIEAEFADMQRLRAAAVAKSGDPHAARDAARDGYLQALHDGWKQGPPESSAVVATPSQTAAVNDETAANAAHAEYVKSISDAWRNT